MGVAGYFAGCSITGVIFGSYPASHALPASLAFGASSRGDSPFSSSLFGHRVSSSSLEPRSIFGLSLGVCFCFSLSVPFSFFVSFSTFSFFSSLHSIFCFLICRLLHAVFFYHVFFIPVSFFSFLLRFFPILLKR